MKQVFRIFWGADETRPLLVLACLLLAALFETIGVATLLPAATLIAGGEGGGNGISAYVYKAIAWLGFTPTLGTLLALIASALFVKSIIAFSVLSYAGISAARVSVSLRRRLLAALFAAKWKFYSAQKGGRFANAVSNDATRAGDAYLLAAQVVSYCVQAVFYAGIAVFMNWRLAVLGLAAGVLLSILMSRLIRISKRTGYKQTDRTADLTVFVVDMLANIKALKTMHRYQPMQKKLSETLKRLRRSLVIREFAKQGLNQGADGLVAILLAAGVYFAHTRWNVPLAELLVSGVVFFKIIDLVSKLQKARQQASQIESAYVRTMELIKLAEANREDLPGDATPMLNTHCRFDGVSFSHGDTEILHNVRIEIPARSITVLMGPSGAGKTTIIDLLIGLHTPSSGTVSIDGVPLQNIDLHKWRRKIGYVPQDLNLLHASIRENITMGDDSITDEAVLNALKLAGAEGFIESLPGGLDTNVGEMGGKLSGGQRQRISLARALVAEPEVLILDEVTSALDPETEQAIVRNIADLGGRYTIVAITHRPAWTTIAGQLYQVTGGRVTAVKPKAQADKPSAKARG